MNRTRGIFSQVNILLEERSAPSKVFPNVYVFGYHEEGKDEVSKYMEAISSLPYGPTFTVSLVEGSLERPQISKEFSTAIKEIKRSMKTKDTSTAFLMVMNPNIVRRGRKEKEVVTQLLRELGSEILSRCVLVLIGGDELLKQRNKLEYHYNEVIENQLCMCDLYKEIYPRIIAIDISDTYPYVDILQSDQILSLLLVAGARFDKPVVVNYWKITAIVLFLYFGICLAGFLGGLICYYFICDN